jgi:hypothetical protein
MKEQVRSMTHDSGDFESGMNQDEFGEGKANIPWVTEKFAWLVANGLDLSTQNDVDLETRDREFALFRGLVIKRALVRLITSVQFLRHFKTVGLSEFEQSMLCEAARLDIIADLYCQGEWNEPMVSLVNNEIPGQEPTSRQFRDFGQRWASRNVRDHWFSRTLIWCNRVQNALEARDAYVVTDHSAIMAMVCLNSIRFDFLTPQRQQAELWDRIRASTSNPRHPVWLEIIPLLTEP